MHYRNGRKAENGDKVAQFDTNGRLMGVGVLHDAKPGSDHCNGSLAPHLPAVTQSACLCDCLHLDDLQELLKEKGLDKRPPGR
jgi:hypothetical protein